MLTFNIVLTLKISNLIICNVWFKKKPGAFMPKQKSAGVDGGQATRQAYAESDPHPHRQSILSVREI